MVDLRPALYGMQMASLPADIELQARLSRARRLVAQHLAEPVDLDRMAREAHYSRYHFLRTFRQTYGETPGEYLRRKRMEQAWFLLSETELSVTEVCFAVGFSSLGSFSDRFRKTFGRSPDRFRRRYVEIMRPDPPIPSCFLRAFAFR